MTSRVRTGFTLVELLVVIAIIATLIGLAFPVMTMVKKKQLQTTTQKLMKDVALAVSHYLADQTLLGDTPADFAARPVVYLERRPRTVGGTPYSELPMRYLRGPGDPPAVVDRKDAEQIIDPYGGVLQWTVTNATGLGGRPYTARVEMRSTCGSTDTSDDLTLTWELGRDTWQ